MGKIRRITDVEYDLIQDYQYRYLYEDRETRTERIDAFTLVELDHFCAYFCLISLVLFLDSLDFRLYQLHSALRDEHILLRDQESETDDKCDSYDSPAETISRKYESKSDKEIVYWIVEYFSKKDSHYTGFANADLHL